MNDPSGVQRIATVFERARAEGRAALMPYLTLGYPTPEASTVLIEAAVAAGADLLELGVPFSDPPSRGAYEVVLPFVIADFEGSPRRGASFLDVDFISGEKGTPSSV